MARSWLPALSTLAGRPVLETKSLADRAMTTPRFYLVPGQPTADGYNLDKILREGFEVNPWVFRCVDVYCKNWIRRRMVIRQGDPDNGKAIPTAQDRTRLTKVLNKKANYWERGIIFRYRLMAQFLLSMKGVYIEVVRTRGGGISSVMLLDVDSVNPVPTRRRIPGTDKWWVDPIGTFQVQRPSGGYDQLPRFQADEQVAHSVLWIRSPHPTLPFRGMSPVQAAAMAIDLDRYARIYNKRFMMQDGRPGGLIMIKGQASGTQMEIVQSQFEGGPDSLGRTPVISGEDLKYIDTSGNPRDMQWGDTMDRTRKETGMVFGMGESVMGDASGRTFDNADTEYAMYLEQSFSPVVGLLDEQLDELTGAWDDEAFLRTDLSDVWVLGRHQREKEALAAQAYKEGRCTLDEYRKVCRLEPLNQPWTRVLWHPNGAILPVSGNLGDAEAAAKLPRAQPPVADPATEAHAGAVQGSTVGARIAGNDVAAHQVRAQGRAALALKEVPATNLVALDPTVLADADPYLEGEQRRARATAAGG